ncbi:MAG: ATPase, T2SS/T4P/T4SS family [Myxococcota bacterium]
MSLRAQKLQSLAEELAQEGLINAEQLAQALEQQKSQGEDLGDILIRKGFLSESDFNIRLAKKAGVPVATPEDLKPDRALTGLLQAAQANRWQVIPIGESGKKLTVATSDPFDFIVLDEIRAELGREITFALASRHEIRKLIETYYTQGPKNIRVIEPETSGMNAVSLVDELVDSAYAEKASDIHIEAMRDSVQIRYRVDGVLEHRKTIPINFHQSVLSRIKILGGMDVAEHRIPQDGRFRRKTGGQNLDIRIATYPTILGESAAIRLLSKESLVTLEDMGLGVNERQIFEQLIRRPHGIFLVTGPTGSGKTTTLYTALHNIDRNKNHVLTVEDPVENEIEFTSQTQVNVKAGLTFATVLRSMLREDPDIIMVGEIRDQETAEISCRAAMTGHLVLSTLHTNTAIGAISRLIDLGLQPYLISSTLIGVMAQRLVRKLCPHCRIEAPIPKEVATYLANRAGGSIKNFKSTGCSACKDKGYKGRVGIYELIPVDDEIRVLINTRAPEVRIRERAKVSGCTSIFEDGLDKVTNGITSIEEVFRVCGETL